MILWFRDVAAEDNSGIMGILNRLEKDRIMSLGTSTGHQSKGSSENGDHLGYSRDMSESLLFLLPCKMWLFHLDSIVILYTRTVYILYAAQQQYAPYMYNTCEIRVNVNDYYNSNTTIHEMPHIFLLLYLTYYLFLQSP